MICLSRSKYNLKKNNKHHRNGLRDFIQLDVSVRMAYYTEYQERIFKSIYK